MPRPSWKLNYFDPFFFRNIESKKKKKVLYISSRRSCIPRYWFEKKAYVYNGKSYDKIIVEAPMVGEKFGSFIFTKKRGSYIHGTKKKGKKK